METSQDTVHLPLKSGWGIAKAKWHYTELEQSLWGANGCLPLVTQQVKGDEDVGLSKDVQCLTYMGYWVGILPDHPIKLAILYTVMHRSTLLLYRDKWKCPGTTGGTYDCFLQHLLYFLSGLLMLCSRDTSHSLVNVGGEGWGAPILILCCTAPWLFGPGPMRKRQISRYPANKLNSCSHSGAETLT